MNIFTILDTKSAAYMTPFCVSTAGVALRHFSDSVNNSDTPFFKHPEDYILFHIGYFDEHTGELVTQPPASVAKAVDLITEP